MKRICFAIGLLPFAACVVDPDDDDGSANTEGADASNSNTSPTTNPSTSGDSDSQTGSTTEPDTSSGSGSGSETGTPGGLGVCDTVCSTFEDCCEAFGVAPEMCTDQGIGGYVCEATECLVLGCADDMECQDLFMLDAWACNPDTDGCWIPCDTLDDCEMAIAGAFDTCDPDLGCTNAVEPPPDCNDTPCNAPYVCDEASGVCVECLADEDCADSDFGPYCDTAVNLCACMTDDDCAFELDACEH